MAYPHKRHRFQKFIVFLFAIVIILLVGYFVALPKIKTKATGIVAEKLLESQIRYICHCRRQCPGNP